MKVYLDDERQTPDGWVRTYDVAETIELLKTGSVTDLSLDHDLALEHYSGDYSKAPNGYDVLVWLEEQVALHNFRPPPRITAHTMNPVAWEKMNTTIRRIREIYSANSK